MCSTDQGTPARGAGVGPPEAICKAFIEPATEWRKNGPPAPVSIPGHRIHGAIAVFQRFSRHLRNVTRAADSYATDGFEVTGSKSIQ